MESEKLQKLARRIRYYILIMTHAAGSGHPTSCFSAVDLATVLFFRHFQQDLDDPENPANDRFILSKGHASALLYALYAAAGKLTKEELMGYRTFDSVLEGHPTKRFPFTEAATGSLGQGLSVGAGEAYAIKKFEGRLTYESLPQVFVLLGDGELAEGAVWEAANFAAIHKLNNLIALADINRFGQAEETMHGHNIKVYQRKFKAFGWETIVIDGHNLIEIDTALEKAVGHEGGPFIVIAKTLKGKGITTWENKDGWHNRMLTPEEKEAGIRELGEIDETARGVVKKPGAVRIVSESSVVSRQSSDSNPTLPPLKLRGGEEGLRGRQGGVVTGITQTIESKVTHYKPGEKVATKVAFGNALERLGGEYTQLVVLDADMKNSTTTDRFEKKFPERFFQMYIAEGNMVGVATGLARQGLLPFVSTFGAFLMRAHDQIRMAPLSNVTILFNGAYGGVALGKDGPSQMILEDAALFRPLIGSTVLFPADAVACERLVEEMVNREGLVYIRTVREPTPMIYSESEQFMIGGSKVHYSSSELKASREASLGNSDSSRLGMSDVPRSNSNEITIVSAGITVHEALKAQKQLEQEGIAVRVIDCYSLKPIDVGTLKLAARETKAIITVEDHYPVGGLGDAVLEALADETHPPVYKLAVYKMPRSGKPEELLDFEDISARAIVAKVKAILG